MKKRVARKRTGVVRRTAPKPSLSAEPLPTGEIWEELIGRIAARALAEYREPVYRPALRRHLPDLAIADPKLPTGKRGTTVRLLQSDLDLVTIEALLTDERPRHQKRNLPTNHPRYDTLKQWLRWWLDSAIEEARKLGDVGRACAILRMMGQVGVAPDPKQKQAIHKMLEEAIGKAGRVADPDDDFEDWGTVNVIVQAMKRVEEYPSNNQWKAIQEEIQETLQIAIPGYFQDDWIATGWSSVSCILKWMDLLGLTPSNEQRRQIKEGIRVTLDVAFKRARDRGDRWYRYFWYGSRVPDIVPLMARFGIKPTVELRQAMQQWLYTVIEKTTGTGHAEVRYPAPMMADWYPVPTIFETMETTELQRQAMQKTTQHMLDRVIPEISENGSLDDWYTISYILEMTGKHIGVAITDEQRQVIRQGIQKKFDFAIVEARKFGDGLHWNWAWISSIIATMRGFGVVRTFEEGPAMTLKEVEEELHEEGADFAKVPPLPAHVRAQR